jgi:predicted component of type VI protein secretion system
MAHTYFVMKRTGQPDRVLVWDTRTLAIGRAKENDIVLADNEISRRHAIFKKEGNRFGVGDYQTGNGTFVNGERIAGTELHPLRSGDVVQIATLLTLEFHDGDVHPAKRGLKLDYASHLKTVGMMPANANPNATMLGMAELPPADEDFVIERRSWDDKSGPPALLDEILIEKKADEKKIDESLDFIDDPDVEVPPATKIAPVAKSAPPAAAQPAAPPRAAPAAKPAAAASPAAGPGDSQTQTESGGDPIERMRRLKMLLAEGLITEEEFARKRARILEEI